MACSTVTVQGSLYGEPIEVNALQANNSSLTQISRKLATALGLTEFSDVYVGESISIVFGGGGPCLSWKISKFPIVVKSSLVPDTVMYSYPVINGNESDAFYEMIIGQDINRFQRAGLDLMMQVLQKSSPRLTPTPGPGFKEDTIFMGHNVRFADLGLILSQGRNEFIEYPCLCSEAIDRIAVNYKSKQVAVRYKSAATVYRYKGVSDRILVEIHSGSSSKGQTVSVIRSGCSDYTSSNVFPDCHIFLR